MPNIAFCTFVLPRMQICATSMHACMLLLLLLVCCARMQNWDISVHARLSVELSQSWYLPFLCTECTQLVSLSYLFQSQECDSLENPSWFILIMCVPDITCVLFTQVQPEQVLSFRLCTTGRCSMSVLLISV